MLRHTDTWLTIASIPGPVDKAFHTHDHVAVALRDADTWLIQLFDLVLLLQISSMSSQVSRSSAKRCGWLSTDAKMSRALAPTGDRRGRGFRSETTTNWPAGDADRSGSRVAHGAAPSLETVLAFGPCPRPP